MRLTYVLSILSTMLLLACDDDHGHSADTLPGCVEEHSSLSEVDAIAECLDDELGIELATQAECETYVEQNGGFAASRQAGCEKYFELRAPDAGLPLAAGAP